MLHIALSAARVGSLTYYLPVLVADEDEAELELDEQRIEGGAERGGTQQHAMQRGAAAEGGLSSSQRGGSSDEEEEE